jgi:hypothetical protein
VIAEPPPVSARIDELLPTLRVDLLIPSRTVDDVNVAPAAIRHRASWCRG